MFWKTFPLSLIVYNLGRVRRTLRTDLWASKEICCSGRIRNLTLSREKPTGGTFAIGFYSFRTGISQKWKNLTVRANGLTVMYNAESLSLIISKRSQKCASWLSHFKRDTPVGGDVLSQKKVGNNLCIAEFAGVSNNQSAAYVFGRRSFSSGRLYSDRGVQECHCCTIHNS